MRQITKTVIHTSKYLNKGKLDILTCIDAHVLCLKNNMSQFVYEHILELNNSIVLSFANKYYKQYKSEYLSNWEIQQLFIDICKKYHIVVDRYFKNTVFEVQKSIHRTVYKRNTDKHNKGDLKEYWIIKKKSTLNALLKYLIQVPCFDNIRNKDILFQLDSFDEYKRNKILEYAKQKQNEILNKIPVLVFRTGTYTKFGFTTSSKKVPCFIVDDTNKKYKYWYIYTIRGNKIALPLQINKQYHNNYHTDKFCKVGIKNNKVFVYATKQEDEPIFNNIGESIGVDVNVVNNFITCSDGYVLDYDREYLSQLFKAIKRIDSIGYNNLSKNQLKCLKKIVRRNEWYFKRLIHDFLQYCQSNNIVNIVMENLRNFEGTFIRDKETGIKYSRIVRLLHLSNIKNWIKEQAEKLGIRVHITPSQYTSQQCPICGSIDKANRHTQEKFECKNCGHADNADHNASVNVKNRFTSNVLKNQLHKQDEYGRLLPYITNKYAIKRILENCVIDT